jgi:hypothetical protein
MSRPHDSNAGGRPQIMHGRAQWAPPAHAAPFQVSMMAALQAQAGATRPTVHPFPAFTAFASPDTHSSGGGGTATTAAAAAASGRRSIDGGGRMATTAAVGKSAASGRHSTVGGGGTATTAAAAASGRHSTGGGGGKVTMAATVQPAAATSETHRQKKCRSGTIELFHIHPQAFPWFRCVVPL